MDAPTGAHATAKHTLTLLAPLYDALKRSAAKQRKEPNELIVDLIADHVMKDGTLDKYTNKRIIWSRELIEQIVSTAIRRCRDGKFSEAITQDTIDECIADKRFAEKYEWYVEDDIYKHGNPLKAINREFGYRIRAAIGGKVMKEANGKPTNVKVAGRINQSYTPMESFDLNLV